jgi:hypothetical protein
MFFDNLDQPTLICGKKLELFSLVFRLYSEHPISGTEYSDTFVSRYPTVGLSDDRL